MYFHRPAGAQRPISLALIAVTVLVLLVPDLPLAPTFAQDQEPPSGDVIVVLAEDSPASTVMTAASSAGVEPEHVFTEVIDGFSASVSPAEAEALAASPLVEAIYPDTVFRAAEQTVPTGVDRIGADENPSTDIDGLDDVRIYSDVAVLDSGIASNTTDLKLMGGVDCHGGYGFDDDRHGHGTHVAGIIGALDNGRGVVGVAPGVRLWSVRVLDEFGNGTMASLICGLEWVYANSNVIDLVNISIEGRGPDGPCESSPFHAAICRVVNEAGIPIVAAAGNRASDASTTIPATYSEVIAVSSIDDFDGQPGGTGTTEACPSNVEDDRLAVSSNVGPDIDIAAPGVCIVSLAPGGGTAIKSGTSMSAPHVTGAAAIYQAVNRTATPAQIRAWLLANAKAQSSPEGFTGDQDGNPEPLVWLGGGEPVVTAPYRLVGSDASVNSAASKYVRDRNLDTVWKTKLFRAGPPDGAWVWVDLGEPRPIGNIRWVFGEYGIGDYFEIEGSNNLTSWSYITKRNGKPVGVWQEKVTSRTFRYIRFRFENPRNDLYLGGLAEVQVWPPNTAPPLPGATPTPTPTSTATPTPTTPPNGNYPMYGSSRSGNSTSPKAVWDGDLGTLWQTDGEDVPSRAHVYVTIGSVLPVGTIRWVFGAEGMADAFEIRVTNDKSTWTTVYSGSNAPAGEWQSVDFSDLDAKYVGWFFENPNADPVIGGLAEVEIYAPGAYNGTDEPTSTPTAAETGTAEPASPVPVATEPPVPSETATPSETVTEPPTDPASPIAVETETPVDQGSTATLETPTIEQTPTEDITATPSGPTPYPVVQTSRSASTLPGTLAVDGDPQTVWQTAPDGDPTRLAVLTLDLGGPVPIDLVRIRPGPGGLMGAATVETSSDGVAWTYFAEPDPVNVDAEGWLLVEPDDEVATPIMGRYVRVVFATETADGGTPLGGIAEIEILPPAAT